MHSDKEKADQFGSVTKHVEWAAAFMHEYPIKTFVYWNPSTMLRDIGEHQYLTGMVLDQAIGFEASGFTPDDYKALVAELKGNFTSHPKNPLVRRAELSPVGFQEIWNGAILKSWLDLVRSGVPAREATERFLN
jgi:hypothetical protein